MLKLSQFENNDSRLPTVLLYPIDNGYIYFDSYRHIGTELQLKRGKVKVATIRMRNEKALNAFKKEFTDTRRKITTEEQKWN